MKRNTHRAAWLSPSPDDEALLLRQKHKLLQVREKGDLALQRRQDLKWWKSQQLQHLAEELRTEWRGPQPASPRSGEAAKDHEPDLELPAQRGTARPQRAREKHRAAVREEKSCKEELMRQQPWHTRPQRRAAGLEKQGATKAVGPTPPPPSPPEKHKGKRAPSTKTSGGHRPVDPRVSKGLDVEKLLVVAGKTKDLEEREKEITREGRRQLGKGSAHLVQGLRNTSLHQSPEGRARDLEQLWPVSSTCRRGAALQASQCERGDKSKWQRELEFAFEELFNTNRKLKKHLSLYLEARPGMDQNPSEEQGFSERQERGGETQ
ncbi:hypothetical protein HPG69_011142 [Diceros bicornis minor]|uniref:Uncharacterized protein n=1 Tax=Diceros bicornis minor TaxID=77932 RepID=A0A7J7EGZ2_DICBM|nr:hypothetical protein HPG69_011142 [Diceros bicornis minor]